MTTNIAYAVQLCDIANREHNKRICGNDRTLLSKKSVKSFLLSVQECAIQHPGTTHTIQFFSDRSTEHLIEFVHQCIDQFTSDQISINIEHLTKPGISNSIIACYKWMQLHGKDFVYQVQDDYLFTLSAIREMFDVQLHLKAELNEYVFLSPYNDNWLWKAPYRNKSTPRVVISSFDRYWIQYYDVSCSFFVHHSEFTRHWDLYHQFFSLLDTLPNSEARDLENKSLNYILTRRGVLGLVPINTLAFHVQSELEEDPYIDWKPHWDNIVV